MPQPLVVSKICRNIPAAPTILCSLPSREPYIPPGYTVPYVLYALTSEIPFPTAFPSSQDGRRRKLEGKRAGLPFAVSASPSEQPVRSACLFFVFSSLPPSSLFLSDSFSLRRLRPPCSPWPHHSLRHSRAASQRACSQDRFHLSTLVVIARPTSRYPPIDTPSLSDHLPRSHGLISTGAGIFTDDIPPFIPARSIAGAVPSQHGR